MDRLEKLQKLNPGLEILPVSDAAFAAYGRVIGGVDASQESAYARRQAKLGSGVVYEAAVPGLEAGSPLLAELEAVHYGGMPAQLGWCYGRNTSLDGLEYHKGSEIDVAVTDCVLLLALFDDIHWEAQPWLDSACVRAFYVPQGAVFELYAWCLHFAPLHVSQQDGFCILVALPRQTNLELERRPEPRGEAALLFGRNKWLLVHPEAEALVRDGAYPGIRGPNLRLQALE